MSDLTVDLDLLADINHRLELRTPNAAAVENVAKAISQHFDVEGGEAPYECVVDSATGVGKTYVLAGLIEYLAGRDIPVRNFLLLAPGRTIRDKSIKNFTPGHKKSLTGAMKSRIELVTADNFRSASTHARMEDTSKTKLFVFTVHALTSKTGDEGRATHEFQETLGGSLYDWLSKLDDLVILADEHHCYRSPAFSRTVAELKPSLIIGLTATPDKKDVDAGMLVYRYPLAHAIRDQYVKTPVLVARKDDRKDDHTKLLDGVTLLRYKEQIAHAYCEEHDLPPVNPVMLVIAKDTSEADQYRDILDSEGFDGGAWVGKTLLVHSNLTGDGKEDALAALEAVEEPDSPVRIIISVGMLKEGWDVKNVYVIASMRASVSDVLTEQTLGRGMRLPFGNYTGIQMLDTVEVLAHERYEELLKKREALNEKFVDYGVWMETRITESGKTFEKKVSDSSTAPVFKPPSDDDSEPAESSSDPVTVQDIDDVINDAFAEAKKSTGEVRTFAPLATRESISLPYVDLVEIPIVVSLNQIDDEAVFRQLGKALATEADDELTRTVLRAKAGTITGVKAEDHVKAATLDTPLDVSRQKLIEAVLNAPGVTPRTSEVTAAESIVDTVIDELGEKAGLRLSAYLTRATRRIVEEVSTRMKAVEKGGVTYQDDVKVVVLDKTRTWRKEFDPEHVHPFQRSTAYNGWKRHLYEYAWFDSSPEYRAAQAVDEGEHVVVWARLNRGDLPITWTSSGQTYHPDLVVVEEIDGERTYWLVEIKMDKEIASEEVTAKMKAAKTWAKTITNSGKVDGKWSYLLLREVDVKDANGNWEQMKLFHQ